ncbi:hypothetical protein SAMN04487965_2457 [Microbulbifer donghaiensis]|uniref:Copper(I)-binding protein n=1 Tax=Microbulbifer donghaiensis TaxID=494016 RepID=A0A1M5DPM8_9GAMM|nr:copper chaperone PCu(A)C [Microbulbifer donghaiensis]SHF68947.1 hypothetical protein SAMN04487965_2457 [Microbulbifer donghaiensis]
MSRFLKLFCGVFVSGLLPGLVVADGGSLSPAEEVKPAAVIRGLEFAGYARETLPGAAMSAAYLSLRNASGKELRLQSVELPGLEDADADLHTTVSEGGVSRMRALPELAIPAGATVEMAPGGVHLMLRGVRLRAGEQLPLRLHFAGGEILELHVPVRQLKAAAEHHHHG